MKTTVTPDLDRSTWEVVVIGAGAAGLLAAIRAAETGKRTLLLEKNRKAGVKILMSGGTRCNLTHATDARGIVEAFGKPGRFLHSSLARLGPADLVDLIEAEGVATKTEPTGKIFPVSNRANDVLQALLGRLRRTSAVLASGQAVTGIDRDQGQFQLQAGPHRISARQVVITTGGKSYPGCGTTGDGYAWARQWGHTIVPPHPALVPVTTRPTWPGGLSGLTVEDAWVMAVADDAGAEVLARRRGSFLFTHFGLSGPAVMDVSRAITAEPSRAVRLVIDLVPAEDHAVLAQRWRSASQDQGKRQIRSLLCQDLPRRLAEQIATLSGVAPDANLAEINKTKRAALVANMKQLALPVAGTLGFKKAEVTAGGVALEEVDSRTMQSKLVPGLYFAGEILDLDGPIGGYNFQAAFSTGWLAGQSV